MNGGSARLKTATYKQDNTNTEEIYTGKHASSGIRNNDYSVPAGEDSSSLRPRCHSGWQPFICYEIII
jgi:hypothetical protein